MIIRPTIAGVGVGLSSQYTVQQLLLA